MDFHAIVRTEQLDDLDRLQRDASRLENNHMREMLPMVEHEFRHHRQRSWSSALAVAHRNDTRAALAICGALKSLRHRFTCAPLDRKRATTSQVDIKASGFREGQTNVDNVGRALAIGNRAFHQRDRWS